MNPVLRWAVWTGLLITLFLFFLFATGPGHSDWVYNADLLMIPVGIALAHRAYKAADLGRLTYLKAVGFGLVVTLVSGAISRLYLYLQLRFWDDSLFDLLKDQWRAAFEAQGKSPQEIEAAVSAIDYTAGSFAVGNFIAFFVPGLVFALLVSLFTRQRRPRATPRED